MNTTSAGVALLEARRLAFGRNDIPVFGPLDFLVEAGEALLVEGGNGAGKTSLLRVLAGLSRADHGQVLLAGEPASVERRGRSMTYLGHLPGLKADLGAYQNLDYLCGLRGRHPRHSLPETLAIVGLADQGPAPVRQLSAGQRKRLSLAGLWLSPAPLWLLDEPYANLDLEGAGLVDRMISAHLRAGGAAVVTTHGAHAPPPVRTRTLALESGDDG